MKKHRKQPCSKTNYNCFHLPQKGTQNQIINKPAYKTPSEKWTLYTQVSKSLISFYDYIDKKQFQADPYLSSTRRHSFEERRYQHKPGNNSSVIGTRQIVVINFRSTVFFYNIIKTKSRNTKCADTCKTDDRYSAVTFMCIK